MTTEQIKVDRFNNELRRAGKKQENRNSSCRFSSWKIPTIVTERRTRSVVTHMDYSITYHRVLKNKSENKKSNEYTIICKSSIHLKTLD